MPPSDWPVSKAMIILMWKGHDHYVWCRPWARGPGIYKKTEHESHDEQVNKQHILPLSASFLASRFLPSVPAVMSRHDGLWAVSKMNSFFPRLSLVVVFILGKLGQELKEDNKNHSTSGPFLLIKKPYWWCLSYCSSLLPSSSFHFFSVPLLKRRLRQ